MTARALVRRGHQVTVIHDIDAYQWLSGKQLPPQPVMQEGVEVIGLRSRLGVVSSLLTHQFGTPIVHGRAIDRLIHERQTDVVVFNNISLVGGPGLLSVGGDALRMYIAHEHWLVCPTHVLWRFNREPCDERKCLRCVVSYRRPPQMWRFTSALERSLSNVDVFLARSEFSRQKHAEFGFRPSMEVLPLFLPDSPSRPSAVSARPHDRPYFLFVGRLTKIKGLDAILPAFAAYPDADLLVVGDGEELDALKGLAANLPNVRFAGAVSNDDLSRFYEHAIAALVPSAGYETFGIVLIEAFRNRTPVIARRIGPFPEIIDQANGGLLFANNEELINAMRRLQRDASFRESLASNAVAASHERWSEEAVIGRFLDIARENLAKKIEGSPR
jgi:glycosyltransferase involved in cell wall biosynthesis